MTTTNPMGSHAEAPFVAEIDGVLSDVVRSMRSPPLGTDLTLHGLPARPQGLHLRVVRIQMPDTDEPSWVCQRCALVGLRKVLGDPCEFDALCRAGTDIALARPEDIPAMTLRGDLA